MVSYVIIIGKFLFPLNVIKDCTEKLCPCVSQLILYCHNYTFFLHILNYVLNIARKICLLIFRYRRVS